MIYIAEVYSNVLREPINTECDEYLEFGGGWMSIATSHSIARLSGSRCFNGSCLSYFGDNEATNTI